MAIFVDTYPRLEEESGLEMTRLNEVPKLTAVSLVERRGPIHQ
jgi:hypothetical protein